MAKPTKEITIGVVEVDKLVQVGKELQKAADSIQAYLGAGKAMTVEDSAFLKMVRVRCLRGAARISESLNPKKTVVLPQLEIIDETGEDND